MMQANIGVKEVRKRLAFGIVMAAAGAGLSIYFRVYEFSLRWAMVLWIVFGLGMLGLMQAKEKT